MKKTAILLALGAAVGGMHAANAALLQAGSTGTITVTSGCFTFIAPGSPSCAVGGNPIDDITDNAVTVTPTGGTAIGSGIAGDGIVGKMTFTVGADGNSFTLNSYNMDTYLSTLAGDIATRMVNASLAGGTLSDTGAMTLDLTGRTGIASIYRNTIGEQAWNLDAHVGQPFCPGTGAYTPFTTGSSVALYCGDGTTGVSLAGSVLAGSVVGGVYTGTGTIVSAGNVGSGWGTFDGVMYSEVYNVTVTGTAVPVPAAVWLFGSGLLGLAGVARRKKA